MGRSRNEMETKAFYAPARRRGKFLSEQHITYTPEVTKTTQRHDCEDHQQHRVLVSVTVGDGCITETGVMEIQSRQTGAHKRGGQQYREKSSHLAGEMKETRMRLEERRRQVVRLRRTGRENKKINEMRNK